MKLNDDLKSSSQPVKAKRKGVSSVGKYERCSDEREY